VVVVVVNTEISPMKTQHCHQMERILLAKLIPCFSSSLGLKLTFLFISHEEIAMLGLFDREDIPTLTQRHFLQTIWMRFMSLIVFNSTTDGRDGLGHNGADLCHKSNAGWDNFMTSDESGNSDEDKEQSKGKHVVQGVVV
jgi:hypothetical protein